jgi:radical SAM superfamily enzyme YgiQ (UPF0313 family)
VTAPHRRVGILDLLSTPSRSWGETAYNLTLTKQYASITPQAIAVWSRQLGHRTHYAVYYGAGDPRRLLPDDLDLVFIASYTQASALAYALAKLYRRRGIRTVLGGPHAKAFAGDAVRFFDVVVLECDRALVADIIRDRFDPGSIVSSTAPFAEVPTVEERMPEIRSSAFAFGRRPFTATTIPLLASTGCPYSCDFCTDWDRPYRQLSLDQLASDLESVATHAPGAMVSFHDPNFAVRFDSVLATLERVPPARRSPYIMEASLSILREERMRRLRDTRCAFIAPGIESWTEYSEKAGVGHASGGAKLDRVVEHFRLLHEYVPYLQANFLFGLDGETVDESAALTREFMRRTPYVWPVMNIPHPFGGTPLFDRYLADNRILTTMPFSFYYSPHLATTLAHDTPVRYYEKLIELFEYFTAPRMLLRRLGTGSTPFVRVVHIVRTKVKRGRLRILRRLHRLLTSDPDFRAFHERRSDILPEYYHREYERMLGPFAGLMSRADRRPNIDGAGATRP